MKRWKWEERQVFVVANIQTMVRNGGQLFSKVEREKNCFFLERESGGVKEEEVEGARGKNKERREAGKNVEKVRMLGVMHAFQIANDESKKKERLRFTFTHSQQPFLVPALNRTRPKSSSFTTVKSQASSTTCGAGR